MPHLIVIYGPPLAGKTTLAREVAGALDDRAAVVSPDMLLHDAIRVHDRDAYSELEMVYTQTRLLVANYLKSRYNVVLEGAFAHEIDGVLHGREHEIDQTVGLMRNLAPSPLLVRLRATPEALTARAVAVSRPSGTVDAARRIEETYRARPVSRWLELRTDERPVAELAALVMKQMRAEYF